MLELPGMFLWIQLWFLVQIDVLSFVRDDKLGVSLRHNTCHMSVNRLFFFYNQIIVQMVYLLLLKRRGWSRRNIIFTINGFFFSTGDGLWFPILADKILARWFSLLTISISLRYLSSIFLFHWLKSGFKVKISFQVKLTHFQIDRLLIQVGKTSRLKWCKMPLYLVP